MTIALSQVIVPLAPVGAIVDDAFTTGNPTEWALAFVARVRDSRANGILCQARIYVSTTVGLRMYGTLPDIDESNNPLLITEYGTDNEKLKVFVDVTLDDDTARLE